MAGDAAMGLPDSDQSSVLSAAHDGVVEAPESSTCPAVDIPDNICIWLALLYTMPPFDAVSEALVPPRVSGSTVLTDHVPDETDGTPVDEDVLIPVPP